MRISIKTLSIDTALPRFETGERSQFILLSCCAELGINNPAPRMQLWDSLVQHALMYGVEVWDVRDISKGVLAGDQLHQDFLQSAVLGPLAPTQLTSLTWAGQVVSFLATLGMPCDIITPQSVNVSAVAEKLQSSYLELVNACSGIKMQQYLHLRFEVDSASNTLAAYLQAIGGWRQRKHLAQLRTGPHWLAMETGRYGNARV